MVEFINSYDSFEGLEYDPRLTGHGAVYGSTSCGKSSLVRDLALNGLFSHCKTIIHLNGNSNSMPADYVRRMKIWWNTSVYCYQIANEEELHAKIQRIETEFLAHRENEYKSLSPPEKPPNEVDMRPNRGFGNCKIIIDDLHKQVIKSESVGMKFQAIRHSGIELLFVTQSFKNVSSHDLIKENLMFVILFKLTQNVVTMNGFLQGLSLYRKGRKGVGSWSSSVEYIYHKLVQMNNTILGFGVDETCYLYINLPKRGPKRVSDLRTAVSNPNIQICLKETGCNDVKILFARRKVPLTYENRHRQENFVVMSVKEQQQYLHENKITSLAAETSSGNDVSQLSTRQQFLQTEGPNNESTAGSDEENYRSTSPRPNENSLDNKISFDNNNRNHIRAAVGDMNFASARQTEDESDHVGGQTGNLHSGISKREKMKRGCPLRSKKKIRKGGEQEVLLRPEKLSSRDKAIVREKRLRKLRMSALKRRKPEVLSEDENNGNVTDDIFYKPPSNGKYQRQQKKDAKRIKSSPSPSLPHFVRRRGKESRSAHYQLQHLRQQHQQHRQRRK